MGKVFTITEGLENMGALKTGGQGSVYKGRRIGEIITAVKLIPTPIYSESPDDKNFVDFQNEVQKLRKVNESPNPNVVKILSSGITETGAFPFIEMEFIEGPDLEELLKEPHDSAFTIKEVIKVAEQLSCALAHCHRVEVKHGDIKSNNVKFNVCTGNYVLLDFGLAVMSDEQRRTSLRHAGAIEFMAPEQNEGKMLFQTDVYSFGVVLYELLGGRVPFPLTDKGETARNNVMLAHMETPAPDVLALRQQHLPQSWPSEKKAQEMQVPQWLVSMIYMCLEKKPEARFANGVALHDYIVLNSTLAAKSEEVTAAAWRKEHDHLQSDKNKWQQTLLNYQQETENKDKQISELKAALLERENELMAVRNHVAYPTPQTSRTGVSTGAFIALLLLAIAFCGLAAYSFFKSQNVEQRLTSNTDTAVQTTTTVTNGFEEDDAIANNTTSDAALGQSPVTITPEFVQDTVTAVSEMPTQPQSQDPELTSEEINNQQQTDTTNKMSTAESGPKYTIAAERAYFHNDPDENTRRAAYMIPSGEVALKPLEERNGFVYIIFTNTDGQTSKGWLRKQDLKLVAE
jgi:eukaryotic-like serine/threonine-protein kinase